VYGVRFGPVWLLFSSTLSVFLLFYLLASAPDHHLDRVIVASSIVTLIIVAAYCHRLIQRLQHSQQVLARLATFDHLTGLPNRRLLQDRLGKALALGPRIQRDIAVLYFDLDGFKRVNDQWGHAIGDKLLCEVANRVQAHLRAIDTVSRIAGDEFVVVLEGQRDDHGADRVAKRILESIQDIRLIDGCSVTISASIGIALWPTAFGPITTTPDDLIQLADRAMYVAKRGGKNQFHCITPTDETAPEVPVPVARPI
jgi:diguanylate cyclase (GGDEF)-like protein